MRKLFLFSVFVLSLHGHAEDVRVDFLNDDVPGCGCFAWEGEKTHAPGKLIYVEAETTKEKILRMKLDGKEIAFRKEAGPEKYLRSESGKSYQDILSGDGYVVKSQWKAVKVRSSPEESARAVTFDVNFLFKIHHRQKKVRAAGYCGC